MTRMSCGSSLPCMRDSRATLITSTDIIKKEHPTPSFSQAVHFLRFLLGTRQHAMSFPCPDRPEDPFIWLFDVFLMNPSFFKAV